MCVCVHARTHTGMHAYRHACIQACMHAYRHACIQACMHTGMHAYRHACIHMHAYTCIHMHTHAYTCIYMHCSVLQGIKYCIPPFAPFLAHPQLPLAVARARGDYPEFIVVFFLASKSTLFSPVLKTIKR